MGFMYDGAGGNGADTYKGQEAYNVLQNFLNGGESYPATDFIVWHINKTLAKCEGFSLSNVLFCIRKKTEAQQYF